MGFSQVWANNEALSISSKEFVKIPSIRAALLDTKSPFYVIPAKIPFGLKFMNGELIVCESHNGGVAIKAWRFDNDEWNVDFLGGGVHLDQYAHLIKIESPCFDGRYSIWTPAKSEAWRNPGGVTYYARIADSYSHIDSEENVPFQSFMNKHWKQT